MIREAILTQLPCGAVTLDKQTALEVQAAMASMACSACMLANHAWHAFCGLHYDHVTFQYRVLDVGQPGTIR